MKSSREHSGRRHDTLPSQRVAILDSCFPYCPQYAKSELHKAVKDPSFGDCAETLQQRRRIRRKASKCTGRSLRVLEQRSSDSAGRHRTRTWASHMWQLPTLQHLTILTNNCPTSTCSGWTPCSPQGPQPSQGRRVLGTMLNLSLLLSLHHVKMKHNKGTKVKCCFRCAPVVNAGVCAYSLNSTQ